MANALQDDKALIRDLALYDPADGAQALRAARAMGRMTEAKALEFLATHAEEIDAEALRLELTGDALEAKARAFALKVLDRMNAEVDSIDLMDAADLLRHALRVLENADRVRIATKQSDKLPVFNFTIGYGSISLEPVDVVDVVATEKGGRDG